MSASPSPADPPAPAPPEGARDPSDSATAGEIGSAAPSNPSIDSGLETSLLRRALLGKWAVPIAGLVAALAITIRTHWFFIYPWATPVSNDEGYLAGMALRMIHGHWLPYVDGVSQRGPILYWLTTAFLRIGGVGGSGAWSWLPIRVEGIVVGSAITVLTFALASVLYSPMAGALASLALTYFLTYELQPWDGIGVNGEPVAVMFALGAALLAAILQLRNPTRRGRYVFWAGFLVACAGLSKQMFLLHGVPIGLWILLGPQGDRATPWAARWKEVGLLMAGFAIPYVFVVGLYAATGHFNTFLYYYQKYGREIFMDPLTRDFMRDKVREQIDRYFTGIAGVGALFFFALSRAVRQTLAQKVEREPNGGDDTDAAVESGERELPLAPESHALLNILVPGLGLTLLPRRRWLGAVAFGVAVALLAVRMMLRRANGIPYTTLSLGRDIGIWLLVGLASGVVCAIEVGRQAPGERWLGIARLRPTAAPWFGLLQMIAAFAGACFTFRFFPHYFVEFFPFAAVVIGGAVALTFDNLDSDDRPGLVSAITLMAGVVILLLIANSALARNVRLRRETDRYYQDPAADPIVRYVDERTTPDESIFVWGFRAEVYLSSRRWPASRYVYTVYPAGVVPWFQATHEEEERRVVPGSREELLADLDREQPELVIDAGRSMNGRYMYNYPVLRSYLDRKYCFMRYVDGEPVYRRRHGERCPPADY